MKRYILIAVLVIALMLSVGLGVNTHTTRAATVTTTTPTYAALVYGPTTGWFEATGISVQDAQSHAMQACTAAPSTAGCLPMAWVHNGALATVSGGGNTPDARFGVGWGAVATNAYTMAEDDIAFKGSSFDASQPTKDWAINAGAGGTTGGYFPMYQWLRMA